MSTEIVPTAAKFAAKRGFVRTFTQTLRATVPLSAITGAALSGADWVAVLWAVVAAALSALLAGAQSYLSIISDGIPEAYVDAALEKIDADQAAADETSKVIGREDGV